MLTEFGKIIRDIRLERKETLADMSRKLGLNAARLSAYENGRYIVSYDLALKLKEKYSLTDEKQPRY